VAADVKVVIAVVVSEISLEEAVKTEVDLVLADVKAEMVATEDAGLNTQPIIYKKGLRKFRRPFYLSS